MKKTIILLTSLILILTFTACSGETAETSSEIPIVTEGNVTESGGEISNAPDQTVTLNTDYENALPVQMQLTIGTFKLNETEYTVDANQAALLLPLWKAARSLSQSETVAVAETEAIFNQIAETMTSEQLAAITAMQLSQDDLSDVAKSLGIEMDGGKFGDMSPEEIAAAQAARESGQGPPGGGLRGNGGPAAPLAGGVPDSNASVQRGATSRINVLFFDAIIALIEAKV